MRKDEKCEKYHRRADEKKLKFGKYDKVSETAMIDMLKKIREEKIDGRESEFLRRKFLERNYH